MIFDISDSNFKKVFKKEEFHLPIRWEGANFSATLKKLYKHYIKTLEMLPPEFYMNELLLEKIFFNRIKKICGSITRSVDFYLNGFPSKAYEEFKIVMGELVQTPLNIYQKSVMEQFYESGVDNNEGLELYRVVCVKDIKPYERCRVFHTPYNMRSKVSTSRYSIAGYPSLYLGTSLELCCEEIHMNPHTDFALASKFKMERIIEYCDTNIRVIELGIKPQDFIEEEREKYFAEDNYRRRFKGRHVSEHLLNDPKVRSAYLIWYPLIAACSFIRVNKSDPFSAEYIIPQLLMQWVRSEMSAKTTNKCDELVGIRYFSCASDRASELGFNYVFPTSGEKRSTAYPYCSVLARAFRLTKPHYIHEYDSVYACQNYLNHLRDFEFIN